MEATILIQVLQLLYFVFVLFEITSCAVDVSIRVGKQGPFTYGNFHERINGSVLRKVDTLITALEADSDVECATSCVMNKLCLSVNFGSEANSTGKVHCELLNYGATDYQDYLVSKEKLFFMRLETIFSSNPCAENNEKLICLPDVENIYQPYSCDCPGHCQDSNCHALGMEDGRILDYQITAFSEFSTTFAAKNGRLNCADGSWLTTKRDKWLQVNLLNRTFIKSVATQGRHNANHFTRTYQLSYSDDGTNWTIYKEKEVIKSFQGNTHHAVIVKNLLTEPFTAKFVRLLPISYHGHYTIRMELYGCPV